MANWSMDPLDDIRLLDADQRTYVRSDQILVGDFARYDERHATLKHSGYELVEPGRPRSAFVDALAQSACNNPALRTDLRDCGATRVESFPHRSKDAVIALVKRHTDVEDERVDEVVIALPEWGAYRPIVEEVEDDVYERRLERAEKAVGAVVEPNYIFWTPAEVRLAGDPQYERDPRADRVARKPQQQRFRATPGYRATPGHKPSDTFAHPEPIVADDETALPPVPREGSSRPVVAILDTGIVEQRAARGAPMRSDAMRAYKGQNPFLGGIEWSDIVDPPLDLSQPIDAIVGHGMFATGIVIRQSGGMVRVDPELTLDPQGFTTSIEIHEDLHSLLSRPGGPPDIVNMSFGSFMRDDRPSTALLSALACFGAAAPGSVFVASAGNDGGGRPFYPAACENVIAVAATNSDGMPMPWSNYGTWVNVCTLGDAVESDYFAGTIRFKPFDGEASAKRKFDGRAVWSGTSWSAPIVSGLIAREMVASRCRTAREAYENLLRGAPRVAATLPDHTRRYGRWLRPNMA